MSDDVMTWPNATFLAWLDRTPLLVRIVATSPDRFSIDGWPCLDGSLHRSGIDIYAMQDGDCWDILWNSDISPAEFASGWGCRLCIDAWEKGLYPKPAVYCSPEDGELSQSEPALGSITSCLEDGSGRKGTSLTTSCCGI
jgi:hypothetical protein